MFPLRYGFAWQDCEVQSSFGFPPAALPAIFGTIQPSDCLFLLCLPSLIVRHTIWRTPCGIHRLSPVDAALLCNMADLRPRDAAYGLTNSAHIHVAYRYGHSVGTPVSLYFGAEMSYNPITSLSTLRPQCYHCVPKARATDGLVKTFWAGFPPAIHYTLCWVHTHL